MWTVILKTSDKSIVAGRFSTRYPESASLPKREEIAKNLGMYTKPSEGTHTFFFKHEEKEYRVRLIYKSESESFTFTKSKFNSLSPVVTDYNFWKENSYITALIQSFLYKLLKS